MFILSHSVHHSGPPARGVWAGLHAGYMTVLGFDPELPLETLSFSLSLPWESLHGSGDLMSMDQVTL